MDLFEKLFSLGVRAQAGRAFETANAVFAILIWRFSDQVSVSWETGDEEGGDLEQAWYDLACLASGERKIKIPVPLLHREAALALYKRAVIEDAVYHRDSGGGGRHEECWPGLRRELWEGLESLVVLLCAGSPDRLGRELSRTLDPTTADYGVRGYSWRLVNAARREHDRLITEGVAHCEALGLEVGPAPTPEPKGRRRPRRLKRKYVDVSPLED